MGKGVRVWHRRRAIQIPGGLGGPPTPPRLSTRSLAALTVQRKVSSSDQGAWIDNFCQDKGLESWQEQEHGCQSDSQGGAGFAAVFG